MAKKEHGNEKAPKLKKLKAQKFTVKKVFAALDGPSNMLGNARAVTIACHCANTVVGNLPRTLTHLGVNGLQFQKCVAQGVRSAGFVVTPGSIPNSPSTTLIQVVNAIQTAPKK